MSRESMEKRMNRQSLIDAQKELAGEYMFAPASGTCYACGQDIVDASWGRGLITGCPKCHTSFVE